MKMANAKYIIKKKKEKKIAKSKFQESDQITLRVDTLRKGMNPLIPPAKS